MKNKIAALILTLTVILALFAACGKSAQNNVDPLQGTSGTAFFTTFETETLDGEKATDEIFKGNKITMVNVWGTFCSPCIREMPDLQKISEDYKDKGVRVIGVICDTFDSTENKNIPQKVEDAKTIVSQTGVKYTNLLPSSSLNKAKLNTVFSVPTTYFLNENGEIIGTEYVGSRSYEQWSQIIDSLL